MVRRWRLIGHFPILYNLLHVGVPWLARSRLYQHSEPPRLHQPSTSVPTTSARARLASTRPVGQKPNLRLLSDSPARLLRRRRAIRPMRGAARHGGVGSTDSSGAVKKTHHLQAGAEIIAENLRNGGELDPMIPGKRMVAIFGFCDIRQFTDATEILQVRRQGTEGGPGGLTREVERPLPSNQPPMRPGGAITIV